MFLARSVYTTPHFKIMFFIHVSHFLLHPSMLKAVQWQGDWLHHDLCFSQDRDSKTIAATALQNTHKEGGTEANCSVSC